ncbi:MAG: type II secretion system F family protein [Bacillota bacterium]|jgi:type IV pilus assembly protein PilC|nr:type II secretion system F family protein [Bacillota bacterium]HHT91467.1 type II secretion system F family protein [Bacillota bacterium]
MIRYAYTGRSHTGQAIRGVIEAESEGEARSRLREEGHYITSLKQEREATKLFQRKLKLKPKNLAMFCRQFAIMLSTGMSLVQSLELLEEQATDQTFAKVLQEVRLDVASGTGFTISLEKHRNVFPHVFIHLVEAGELTGALAEVLDRLAQYYEREDELNKKISEALMYPGIITGVSFLMVLVLLFVVLPNLVKTFSGFGVQTPAITQAVLDGRDWMIGHWYIIVLAIAAFVFGYRYFVSTERGALIRDTTLLKLPVLGGMQKMVIFSRFCRTLSLLLGSGIVMIASLEILERLIDNVVIKRALTEARLGVERGQGLHEPLTEHKVFPLMLVQMVSVGEETGNLETVLVQLADYYDREVNFVVASFTKLIEPIVMLILAVVVLFILISVYLPMMQMVTSI